MFSKVGKIIQIFTSIFLIFPGPAKGQISDQELRTIKSVSYSLEELCPQTTCVLLGIGRSPTPFLAYLETEEENK